jgi:hypothetical protein
VRDEPVLYQLALALIMGITFALVSSVEPPRWLGSLLVGVIAIAAIGALKAIRRRRSGSQSTIVL